MSEMTTRPSARRSGTPEQLAFVSMFGLPAFLAAYLADLYSGHTIKAPRFVASSLRAALESEAIDTTPEGYHLTETGRAECAEALADFRQWVATTTRMSA